MDPVIDPETPRTATSSAADTATTAMDATARPQWVRSSRTFRTFSLLKAARGTASEPVCRMPAAPPWRIREQEV